MERQGSDSQRAAFGLTGNEGNHGEDVKEYYFYLDSTPTHSYMKFLYKYPQREFPYAQLVEENRGAKRDMEYELIDTGAFDDNRYFDVFIEYAKAAPEDILIRIEAINRGPESAPLHLLPTIWFRNTWSWGLDRADRACVAMRPRKSRQSISITITTANAGFTARAIPSCCSPRMKPITAVCSMLRMPLPT